MCKVCSGCGHGSRHGCWHWFWLGYAANNSSSLTRHGLLNVQVPWASPKRRNISPNQHAQPLVLAANTYTSTRKNPGSCYPSTTPGPGQCGLFRPRQQRTPAAAAHAGAPGGPLRTGWGPRRMHAHACAQPHMGTNARARLGSCLNGVAPSCCYCSMLCWAPQELVAAAGGRLALCRAYANYDTAQRLRGETAVVYRTSP